MLFDLPESLVEKARKILDKGKADLEEEKKKEDEAEKEKGKKKEAITFNPEIRPADPTQGNVKTT